jgi:glycosyltransferase involved in cell wall biosynthesis
MTIGNGRAAADLVDPASTQFGRPRTVLMVLYFFPPIGGVSMSRNLRHAQYLSRYGWTPVVLTPSNGAYELRDPEALDSVPPGLAVIRTRSLEPGHLRPLVVTLRRLLRRRPGRPLVGDDSGPGSRPSRDAGRRAEGASGTSLRVRWLGRLRQLLFFPDDQVGWLPFALSAAVRSSRPARFDAVFSTSSPITSHVVAGLFARLTSTPWVAEFRDPWLGNALAAPLPWLHRRVQAKVERWIFRSADRIVCVTPSLTRLYQTRYPAASIVTITNGYDRSEVPVRPTERAGQQRFRIVYTGTLYRPSELDIFLGGVAALMARRPDLGDHLEIAFYGQVTDECRAVADRLVHGSQLNTVVQFFGFVPRHVAMRSLAEADAALVLLGGGPGMGLFIGGKVYDYLGQSKQILAMIPPGDARDVLKGLSWGVIADPDPEDVGRALERLLTLPSPDGPADPAGRYDRETLAGRLADTLTDAVEDGHPIR